ncbi:MAG: InlB B-repeat-containing protein [Butyricicoccus pullicaecorum]|nr:InlB B-repeat-containing protein [Butyricicoccus pullicaecorum]
MKKRILSLIIAITMMLTMCIGSMTAMAVESDVQTATLTINYYLKDGDGSAGNMIHEPYIAELVSGSGYEVKSPQIDGFTLENSDQLTVSGVLSDDTTVNVYYIYAEKTFPYTVVYQGYDPGTGETVILDTVTGYAPADTKVSVEYREFWGYDKDEINDMSLIVTADGQASKTLTYTLKDAPYIIFRTQGSYIQPITAEAGAYIYPQISSVKNPTRPGYDFAGWEYEGETYEDGWALAQALSEMPTVLTYVDAVWNPGVVNYTVLTWFQNAEDDNYTLYTNGETRSGTVGVTVTATPNDIAKGENNKNEAGNAYYGFDYSHCEDTEIAPDGTAVLNLYYDREIWKINYMEEPSGGEIWKTIEGKYMSLIGDKLISQEELKAHYGPTFAYMAKTKQNDDSAMLERFENSKSGTDAYGEQNIFPYFDENIYQYQIRHFSYDPNTDDITERILIQTSYIYYYKSYADGMILVPPEGFIWKGGWWKTASTEAGLANARIQSNPDGKDEDGRAAFYNFYQYAEIFMERDKSTLKYISNGEIIQQIDNVPYEKNVDLSVVPENGKEYMQFEGWYVDPNLMNFTEPLSKCQMPAGDLSLYAKWGPSDCTVTFDTQGGSEVPSQQVKYNTTADEPETPVRAGYSFAGWYTEPNGGDIWTFERTIDGDTTLYAHWRESVTAPFTINHVIEGEPEPFYVQTGKSTIGDTIYATALDSADENYPENAYVEPTSAKSQSIVLEEDGENTVTFTYKRIGEKEYTVSYLDQETKEPLKRAKEVTTYKSVVTELPTEIVGYECTDEDGYETQTLREDGKNEIIFYYTPGENAVGGLTVTKTVSGNAADQTEDFNFQITLDDRSIDGAYGDITFEDGVADFTLHHNQSVVVSGLPVGTAYEVEELQDNQAEETAEHVHDAECGYVEAEAGSPCTHEHDENCGYIPAVEGSPCTHEHTEDCYIEEVNCVVEADKQASENQSEEELAQTPMLLPSFADDHVCTEESGCITKVLDCQHEHDTECGYAEAVAETPCTHIHDDSCGYVADIAGTPCQYSDGEAENPDNDAYTVTSTNEKGTIQSGAFIQVHFNNHRGDPLEYTLTYYANYPESIQPPVSETHAEDESLTLEESDLFTRDGYELVGWNTATDGSGESYECGVDYTMPGEHVQLYAQWKEKEPEITQYTLTYVSNGGTKYPSETYDDGTTVSLTKTPTRDGYTFQGWCDDVDLETVIDEIYMDDDKTVYAKWEKDSGGGAYHPEVDPEPEPKPEEPEEVPEEEIPLAETPWLNTDDHYAYIIGYAEDGTVRPNANITRAEVATIFFRLLTDEARDQFWSTSNNFSDVTADAWYNNAVSTMVNAGIIQGYEDGTFRPNNNITRAEFAAIASRFMSSGYDVEKDLFSDIASHWARESINDAAMTQWIHGYLDGTFLPNKAITRAEAVTLVNNVLQRKPDADHMLDSMIKWPDNMDTSAWYYEAIQEATNSHDYDLFEGAEYETWTALQENRDWAALEKDWLNAHRTGGEVM